MEIIGDIIIFSERELKLRGKLKLSDVYDISFESAGACVAEIRAKSDELFESANETTAAGGDMPTFQLATDARLLADSLKACTDDDHPSAKMTPGDHEMGLLPVDVWTVYHGLTQT